MDDLISRQAAIDAVHEEFDDCLVWDESEEHTADEVERILDCVPSAQPEYEELTPEEAASEIARGSIMSAWYWLDVMMPLKQMGYAICRKR